MNLRQSDYVWDFIEMAKTVHVSVNHVKKFISECMTAVGTAKSHAQVMSDVLVASDIRGHFSHGLNRLEMYVRDVQTGITVGNGNPVTEKESAATALVDGQNNLGPIVGKYCMEIAVKKAKHCGVGWVAARGSNHFGIAGYYSILAANEGLIGMAMTNTSPLVVPTRAKECTLGTNPIGFIAPAEKGDSFDLDMATSAVAIGKVELHNRKAIQIPGGWGANADGQETNHPSEVLNGGGLLPLGGTEESGGYKGYGLAMMVEVLCGILSGAHYGPKIRKWGSTDKVADLGHCFIAVDPNMFGDGFSERLQEFINIQRSLVPRESSNPVLVAGDPERAHTKNCELLQGIPYPRSVVEYMNSLGRELGVEPMHER